MRRLSLSRFLLSGAALVLDDGHLHLDGRVDVDGSDLLHNLGGRVQVDQTLVDLHLEAIPEQTVKTDANKPHAGESQASVQGRAHTDREVAEDDARRC